VLVGRGSPVSEEGAGSLHYAGGLLRKSQCGRLIIEIRVHADEPSTHGIGRLSLFQQLHNLVGVPKALFSLRVRIPGPGRPLTYRFGIAHAAYDRDKPLTQDVLKRSDDGGQRQADSLAMDRLFNRHISSSLGVDFSTPYDIPPKTPPGIVRHPWNLCNVEVVPAAGVFGVAGWPRAQSVALQARRMVEPHPRHYL
jgi:hypothetical protein